MDTFYGPLGVRITVHKVTNDDKTCLEQVASYS